MRILSPSKAVPAVEPNRVFIGDMLPKHRGRVRDILAATAVFRDDEIEVAIELFDSAFGTNNGTEVLYPGFSMKTPASSDYFFIGAFSAKEELAGFACYGPTPATRPPKSR